MMAFTVREEGLSSTGSPGACMDEPSIFGSSLAPAQDSSMGTPCCWHLQVRQELALQHLT